MFSSPVSIKLSCGMEFIVLPRRRSKPMSILLWEGLSAEAANGWPWHMVGAQNRSRNVCFVPKADITPSAWVRAEPLQPDSRAKHVSEGDFANGEAAVRDTARRTSERARSRSSTCLNQRSLKCSFLGV